MNQEELKNVSLATLGRGAAVELFDDEFAKVVDNIMDPNTPTEAREITLKVVVKPNDARNFCAVSIGCKSKLSSSKVVSAQVFIGRDGKGLRYLEHDPNLNPLPFKV